MQAPLGRHDKASFVRRTRQDKLHYADKTCKQAIKRANRQASEKRESSSSGEIQERVILQGGRVAAGGLGQSDAAAGMQVQQVQQRSQRILVRTAVDSDRIDSSSGVVIAGWRGMQCQGCELND
ncbi:hypothetical protein D8674_031159 [Pyrus ussuriensis x Pyrus communis]|uniref:Uncharacterized protein n=1 Tax=Pyrus ussuriensis x Pyrus communis TaxID=2448454 RepID=A0A5N5EXR3_9ROSA|nr:hypothetical protein D8674_031159 [Pyrus ussuriensis x Pyrus communis]